MTDRKSEFDIRSSKIRIIGKFTEQAALSYREALQNTSQNNLFDYYTNLKTIYRQIKYIRSGDLEDKRERIEKILEEAEKQIKQIDSETPLTVNQNILSELEEAEDKISEYRLEVNLDLPTSEIKEEDPTDWYE